MDGYAFDWVKVKCKPETLNTKLSKELVYLRFRYPISESKRTARIYFKNYEDA
jgi:hypothetical protein